MKETKPRTPKEKENEIERLKILREESVKIESVASVGTAVIGLSTHIEIRMIDNGKLANRGFKLIKTSENKVNNGELFQEIMESILLNIFTTRKIKKKIDKEIREIKVLTFNKIKKLELKQYNFKFEIKPFTKKIKLLINSEDLFTIRKVKKENGNYYISQSSIEKSYEIIERKLFTIFKTTRDDFVKCLKVIESSVEYLMVI